MNRVRHYLPPLLLLLPVIFICGKLLLTPVQRSADDGEYKIVRQLPSPPSQVDDRGWPWSFRVSYYEPTQGKDVLIWFSWWSLIADLILFFSLILAVYWLLAWRRRRFGGWFRFSIREILLATAAVAVLLAWALTYHTQCKRQRTQLTALESAGVYIFEIDCGPNWFRRLFGDSTFFEHVTKLEIHWASLNKSMRHDELIAVLQTMPIRECESIDIENALTEADAKVLEHFESFTFYSVHEGADLTFEILGRLPRLKAMTVGWDGFSHRNLIDLANSPALEELNLSNVWGLDDVRLIALLEFKHLRRLSLSADSLSDPDIRRLSQMTQLEELTISRPGALTDEGLRHLLDLPNLKSLHFEGVPRISAEAEQMLKRKIPQVVVE